MKDAVRTAQRLGWWRLLGQSLAFFVLWPWFAVIFATLALSKSWVLGGAGVTALLGGTLIESLRMWRELVVVGVALTGMAALTAALSGGRVAPKSGRASAIGAGVRDALLVSVALYLGIALELPAALYHPAAAILRFLPVWLATAALGAIVAALAVSFGRLRGSVGRHVVVTAGLVILGFTLVRIPPGEPGETGSGARIVLGLDSLSRRSADEGLRRLCETRGGTWYERAVTPGLLTNVVWSGVMTSHRPSEIGVFLTFQAPDWRTLPPNLVDRARAAGLRTVAFFADQFTMQLGADLPFDEDRSGPRGWRQVVTSAFKDAGVFLPVVLPLIPPIPGATTPANQEGTYAFSLQRELSDVLTAGRRASGSLVLAHLDYLHQPRYPGYSELTPGERKRVLAARLATIVDQSLDWQYPATPDEPLDVYRWKIEHLVMRIANALDQTRLLDPARGNALVLFSDHGARTGLRPEAFGDESYYGVPLITFGLPARDPRAPISLLDIPSLIGLPSPVRPGPADPVVEYVNVAADEFDELLRTSAPLSDGGIHLPKRLVAKIGSRMLMYRPYAPTRGYAPAESAPARERPLSPKPTFFSRFRTAALMD